ncbi:Carboxypeptidase B [Halotydeus destructor]|nr:Carboxypeptidase B [Halotydeus destructor]
MFKLIVALVVVTIGSAERTFEDFTVFRVVPENEQQVLELIQLQEKLDTELAYVGKTDFWRRPTGVDGQVDLMVAPDVRRSIEGQLRAANLTPSVMVRDVQKLVNVEKANLRKTSLLYGSRVNWLRQADKNAFFQDYHRIEEIHEYMSQLAANQNHVSLEVIGKSTEGRELKAFKIGFAKDTPKPVIWVDGGIHAREWISPATVLYIATTLIRDAETDSDVTFLLNKYDFVILPSSNPDGYDYTHNYDRLWRKTRSRSRSWWGLTCRGADPNRNWDFHWMEKGASDNPCSDIYAGPEPFSEPETKAISKYIEELVKGKVVPMYLSFHSYSQLVLTPWGWTEDLPEAYPDLERRGLDAAAALAVRYATEYKVGSSTRVLYSAAGGSDDWAHGVAKIKYAYTVELRDTGDNGFILPKEEIIPSGEETWDFFKNITMAIAEEY